VVFGATNGFTAGGPMLVVDAGVEVAVEVAPCPLAATVPQAAMPMDPANRQAARAARLRQLRVESCMRPHHLGGVPAHVRLRHPRLNQARSAISAGRGSR
jgi:hypothetical protein